MIFNQLFSTSERLKQPKLMKQAKTTTIEQLLFNHFNPTFDFTLMAMNKINKEFNKEFNK